MLLMDMAISGLINRFVPPTIAECVFPAGSRRAWMAVWRAMPEAEQPVSSVILPGYNVVSTLWLFS